MKSINKIVQLNASRRRAQAESCVATSVKTGEESDPKRTKVKEMNVRTEFSVSVSKAEK